MKKTNWLKRASFVALTFCLVGTSAGLTAPVATAAQSEDEWNMLQNVISKYYGEWTDASYKGLFVSTMPKTALLGNGDVGVASGGDAESKSFYISKGDFWAYNGSPLPVGGVTIRTEVPELPDPQSTSLAFEKTVTSSGDHYGYPASRAVNGQWSEGYEGWVSPVGNPQWMAVDLGEEKMFNRFVIRHDAASRPNETANVTRNFKLQTSSDGSEWSDVYDVTGNQAALSDIVIPTPVTARYVRLYITKGTQETTSDSTQNPRARIGQFEVYYNPDLIDQTDLPETPEEPVSLTLHKAAKAIGSHQTLVPDRAVNGEWSANSGYEGWTSGYHGDGQPGPWWLEVDLGAATAFNRLVVHHDGAARPAQTENNTKDFQLQTRNSEDDAWVTVYDVTGNSSSTTDVRLNETVTARYARLYITAGTQGNTDDSRTNPRARIGQFELYNESDEGNEPENGETSKVYDLGGSLDISRYVVRLAQAGEVVVEASEDGSAWHVVGASRSEGKIVDVTTDAFAARYVRVTADDAASAIVQVSLFETPGLNKAKPEGTLHEIQDILNAEVRTETEIAKTPLTMRTWTSATSNVVVTELKSEGEEPVRLVAELWGKTGNAALPVTATHDGNSVTVTRETSIDSRDAGDVRAHVSKAALAAKLIGADGAEISSDQSKGAGSFDFVLNPAKTVYIVTAVGGGGRTYDYEGTLLQSAEPEAQAAELLSGLAEPDDVDTLLNAHRAWWKDFWLDSYIVMDTADPKLDTLMRYYYAAQYILGSSIREDKVAPGLYSIWHTTDSSQWSSDYHMNYNFISTFYGVNSSNRPWMGVPAIDAILNYVEEGTRNAGSTDHLLHIGEGAQGQQVHQFVEDKIIKGDIDPVNGISDALLYPVSLGPWGMKLERGYSYYGQLLDAIFSAYPLIEYYEYTQDESFLPDLYDYLKKSIALYEAWLEEENGEYTLYSAYNEGSWGRNSAVELAVLKSALTSAIQASELLDEDADKRADWQHILEHLAPQPTAQYAGKTIFSLAEKHWSNNQWEDLTRPIPWDGNILPMESVIPGNQLGYYSTKEQLEIARNTIQVFVDEAIGGGQNGAWSQYNNFPKIFANAVRVRYPAQEIVDNFVLTIEEQMEQNLTITDDSDFHGAEKSGATEAINSMMLLSDNGVLKVFPNWLNDRDAAFANLRAKGAFVVSSAFDGDTSQVQYVDLVSEAGRTVTIASPWANGIVVTDENGNAIQTGRGTAPNHAEEMTYTFNTTTGAKYRIRPAILQGGGNGVVTPPEPDSGEPNRIKAPAPKSNADGVAATAIAADDYNKAKQGAAPIYIDVPAIEGANAYEVTLPAEAVAADDSERNIEISTSFATFAVTPGMLGAAAPQGAKLAAFTVAKPDASKLSAAAQAEIAGKPVVDIALKADGVAVPWDNPDQQVSLFIPYTPTADELADPEHIVVRHIDGEGRVVAVPNGKYDAKLGGVTFTTTRLGTYAVAYVTRTFDDIAQYDWAAKAIEVMASKGVINGTSANTFTPNESITRADFILLLVKALGLSSRVGDNFGDVDPAAYYAEAAAVARKLGIARGVDDNRFNPDAPITRQDMMVLIDRAMAVGGKVLTPGTAVALDSFADQGQVASYAEQSAAKLVTNKIVIGNGSRINPLAQATRAETAVIIYRIYNR